MTLFRDRFERDMAETETKGSEVIHFAHLRELGRTRNRRGAALLEVALTLPILLLVLAMIGDFSRAYIVAKAVDNATSQGALAASTLRLQANGSSAFAASVEARIRLSMSMYSWYVPTQLAVQVNSVVDTVQNTNVNMSQIRVTYAAEHLIQLPGLPANYTIERTLRIDRIR